MKKESAFQAKLIKRLKTIFPNCIVLKNDANYIQGFPDLTVLNDNGKWALLECKREKNAHVQPNQQFYIDKGNSMGFARFICPENEEEVLSDLQQAFRARR
jgi:hypothetical protein